MTKDLKQERGQRQTDSRRGVDGAKLQGGTIAGAKLKAGSVGTGKIADGAVTADKLAPGAVAFPNTLWGPMIRNQTGAGHEHPGDRPVPVPLGIGSLQLRVTGAADLAAFGDSVDFAGVPLDSITGLGYSSFNDDATPLVAALASVRDQPAPGRRLDATVACSSSRR